jgi:hypothetical protein
MPRSFLKCSKQNSNLPAVYDYQEFGNVSSGGLWLGNIMLEFVNYRGGNSDKALFKGLALEPVQHTDTITQLLDDYGVVYNPPVPVRFTVDGVDKTYWTNIVLKDLTSSDIRVFICDYTDRSFLSLPKKTAGKYLQNRRVVRWVLSVCERSLLQRLMLRNRCRHG